MTLKLRFTRVSPTRHRLEYRREDGTGEAIAMETKSLLVHDLVHFAVESEAGLKDRCSASSRGSAATKS
jgi:hypothetical protein